MNRVTNFFKLVARKIKGWKTALFATLVSMVAVFDLQDFIDILPDDVKADKVLIIIISFVFLYLRHVTDTPPAWRQKEKADG